MSPMHKSLTALAAAAMLATVGYAAAQSTDPAADPAATQMQPMQPSADPSQSSTTTMSDQATSMQPADTAAAGTTQTTTTTDTQTQVIPAPPVGVVELARPKGTVAPTDKQADGPMGQANTVMTTGVTNGATRPSIGDHATPPIQPEPTVIAVTTERTTTTTTTPAPEPAAAPVPEPAPQVEAPAPEPMPAPKADRN